MKTFTYKMTRVYETIIEVEAENKIDARIKFDQLDIYQIELEQCCITYQDIELENDFSLEDKTTSMFLNQIK